MRRRDYELIAQALVRARMQDGNTARAESWNDGIAEAAMRIAKAIKRDNASFDVERFLNDCGVSK